MRWLMFFSLWLVSCAHSVDSRSPASSMDPENLERSFRNLLGSSTAEQDFADHIYRLNHIYYRTEAELREFDQELDEFVREGKTEFLNRSLTYPRMLALWELRHRMTHKLAYIYRRLLEVKRGPDGNEKERALKILDFFQKTIRNLTMLERISSQDALTELYETNLQLDEKEIVVRPMSQSDLMRESSKERAAISARAQEEKMKGSFEEEIENAAAGLKIESGDRSPQSQNLRPSPGPDGNITGRSFPLNTWVLTYDDGPHDLRTDLIRSILSENGVKATFFELARNVMALPVVVGRLKSAGMELANHSYSHAQLTKLDMQGLRKEIEQSSSDEARVFGFKPKFFRCPYGAGVSNSVIRQMIANQGMIHVFWNVDTLDWQDKNPQSVFERTKKQMQAEKKGVILYHDIHPQTVEATKMLMDYARSLRGTPSEIRWKSLEGIVQELNGR